MPGDGVSHRGGPRQDVYENVGSLSVADAVCAHGDFVRAADLCSGGCGTEDAGSEACRDAAGTAAGAGYRGKLVFAERRETRDLSGPIRRIRETLRELLRSNDQQHMLRAGKLG